MFSARRKPKRVVREESNLNEDDKDQDLDSNDDPIIRRPNAVPKTKSRLRTSFAPDEAEVGNGNDNDDFSEGPAVVKPKSKPRLGAKTASTQSLPRFNIDNRKQEDDNDASSSRPSYSKSALEELRNSTPSTPRDLVTIDSSDDAEASSKNVDLDIASKFGAQANITPSAILSAAEIAERKSRRARLAKEQSAAADYISLDDHDDQLYDSDGEFKPRRLQVGSYLRKEINDDHDDNDVNTRLVRDDEDMLEGFDEYTEDANSNRITMGRKQLLQAQRRDREAMREMIATAEGHSSGGDNNNSNDSDSEEAERNYVYEAAQTGHGMDGLVAAKAAQRKAGASRPRQPRELTPVPRLNVALDRLRERISRIEMERVKIERRRDEIRRERAEIKASQEHIQRSLIEAGEELEKVQRRQAEEEGRDVAGLVAAKEKASVTDSSMAWRGLDSLGVTPEPT